MKRMISMLAALAMLFAMGGYAAAEEESASSGWWNILLLGGDSPNASSYGRTDSMVILSINETEERVKMTSILRDTWVQMAGHQAYNKINASNVFDGPEGAVETVNHAFGTDIQEYILINIPEMVENVDLFGGVDVEITQGERNVINEEVEKYDRKYDKQYLKEAGLVHLDGLQAMFYSRIRRLDSDYLRVERQQKVLLALAENMQNMDVDELMGKVSQMEERIKTNLMPEQLKTLSNIGLIVDIDTVQQFRVPVDGTFTSSTVDGTWRINPDLEKNQQLLHDFIYLDQLPESAAEATAE